MRAHGVRLVASHAELAAAADLVISAVTASQAEPVAEACARAIGDGAWFLDFNSASPGAKQRAGAAIDGAGGRYVEGAVMTSVPPYRIRVPLLLGGAHGAALQPALAALGFDAKVASDKLGVASATKMCRSVMIKGLEAMVIESFTAARAYGVEDAVSPRFTRPFPASTGRSRAPTSSSASSSTAAAAPRRCAKSPTPCATLGLDALVGRRHRRAPGLGRRPGRRRRVRPARRARLRAQRRLARRGRPHPEPFEDVTHR